MRDPAEGYQYTNDTRYVLNYLCYFMNAALVDREPYFRVMGYPPYLCRIGGSSASLQAFGSSILEATVQTSNAQSHGVYLA